MSKNKQQLPQPTDNKSLTILPPTPAATPAAEGNIVHQWFQQFKDATGAGPIMSDASKQACDGYTYCKENVMKPVKQVYSDLPAQLTEFKQPILQYQSHHRLLLLSAATLGVAVFSRRYDASYLRTIRNVAFSFYGLGLIIAPEVYNPFMKHL